MIDHLIEGCAYLCAMVVLLGTPMLVIGGIVTMLRKVPPRSACRDWRDAHVRPRR